MKRYIIEHPETVAEEHPLGLWVKYEPWMPWAEETFNQLSPFERELIASRAKPYTDYISSYPAVKGIEQPQEPTICVKCKHHKNSIWEFFLLDWCANGNKNYINGEKNIVLCSNKNKDGNCPDFEPKEVNQ